MQVETLNIIDFSVYYIALVGIGLTHRLTGMRILVCPIKCWHAVQHKSGVQITDKLTNT